MFAVSVDSIVTKTPITLHPNFTGQGHISEKIK